MTTQNKYINQAAEFLKKTHTNFYVRFLEHRKYFSDDTQERDVYEITLESKKGEYVFTLGQSMANEGKIPTPYDVLTSVQKYGYESFEVFCNQLGYDTDSRKAEKTYNGVQKEFENLQRLYSEKEMELLRGIQ